ncbi:von Willebrand factor-like [Centruroides vittatus]|uniref:von Willebrand factor-like n=1 Tax=Centruroides vittatus TaxID=120091 RepID=UPI00350FD610
MKIILVLLSTFVLVFSQQKVQNQCDDPNEEFMTCGCDHSCEDNFIGCKTCSTGCFCKQGYVRNINDACIEKTQCTQINAQKICKLPGEIYLECENPCPDPCYPHIQCPELCVPGCYCKPGLIRDKLGYCYPDFIQKPNPKNECKIAGEEYVQCKQVCPKTCDNYKKPINCPVSCYTGCVCTDGLVRNEKGFCVHPTQCKNEITGVDCGSDFEIYMTCGCESTCDNTKPICNDSNCKMGCKCKEGFVRKNNECVPYAICRNTPKPPVNGNRCKQENEIWIDCGPLCIPTCEIPTPVFCAKKCKPGCYCQSDYIRSNHGLCVLPSDCTNDRKGK